MYLAPGTSEVKARNLMYSVEREPTDLSCYTSKVLFQWEKPSHTFDVVNYYNVRTKRQGDEGKFTTALNHSFLVRNNITFIFS